MPNVDRHYDAHCHLLNKDYLLRELTSILRRFLRRERGISHEKGIEVSSLLGRIKEMLRWANQVIGALEGDEEKQLEFLRMTANNAWKDDLPIRIVPLMMDIFYMFDSPVYSGQKVEFKKLSHDKVMVSDDEVRLELEAILQDVGITKEKAEQIIRDIEQSPDKAAADVSCSYDYSKGFDLHREALADLQSRNVDSIFPFFAVDPRRKGVVQAVIQGDFVGKGKSFRGVKLYPRLGYHPCCTDLEPLFKWCNDNRIPIVTHCGPSGFPPFIDSYSDFGAPCSFRKVLEKHAGLIINFAHFGTFKPCWVNEIIALMDQYENVYSDLACYEDASDLEKFKEISWSREKVKDRTMFGTDYSMMYFFKVASLATYYSNFKKAFSKAELLHMDEVAKQFLND